MRQWSFYCYLLFFSGPTVKRMVSSEAGFWALVSSCLGVFIMTLAMPPVWIRSVDVCSISVVASSFSFFLTVAVSLRSSGQPGVCVWNSFVEAQPDRACSSTMSSDLLCMQPLVLYHLLVKMWVWFLFPATESCLTLLSEEGDGM